MIEEKKIKDLTNYLLGELFKNEEIVLVEVKIKPGNIISIEIDSQTGISIDKCVELSREINKNLDQDQEDYELTVASAGISGPLKIPFQFKKFLNTEMEILTTEGKKFKAILKKASETEVEIEESLKIKIDGKKKKEDVTKIHILQYNQIKSAKPIINFK